MRARLIRLMLDTSGQPGCPYYQKVIELIEAHRWSTSTILKHDPSRMLKIAYEVRSKRLLHIGSEELDPELMRKVLVRITLLPVIYAPKLETLPYGRKPPSYSSCLSK